MNNISQNGKAIFQKLIVELARSFNLWIKDRESFYQEIDKSNLVFNIINAPKDLESEIKTKTINNEPCIQQLFHTLESQNLARELSIIIRKCCNLNCLTREGANKFLI
ncbi:Uncharacterised protein [Enterobacter hormaechei]|nr:Uncharacterised protein [Enterobacter hormaechei]SAE06304.1 Uncharacterised protein [Enterobacter hormaechei]SAE75002.1 Uncharacterised protein [Enterobacter hormaechei]STP62215.1 Uncharacterised protein [Enterobacter hormaechei]